ncbi:helix-turn-helix transcriptional regulator [Halocatena marina]|uniref:Helix-turn-helix transcriptional regulator n=1 Tax=Halocatena marina TaxID=2934937 RepID=A0ABD5YZ62_9EURY|nr:ArsR family transcriptional regulator [Halocatena marina]
MKSSADVLTLIAQRAQLVQQLSNEDVSTRSLTQILPASRSTVTRSLNKLEAKGLVQRSGNDYELTHYGRFVYQTYQQVIDRYDTLTAAKPLLHHLPESVAIPRDVFDDATVIRPKPPIPDDPRTQFANRVRQSEKIIGTAKIVDHRLVELFHDQLTTHDFQLSLLIDKQVAEYFRHTYVNIFRTMLEIDHCTLWSAKQMPPFSLVIIDCSELWLGVYNEHGQSQGFLQTESSEAVEWAEQYLQQLTEQATSVDQQDAIAKAKRKQ